jgi:hypothetical protein
MHSVLLQNMWDVSLPQVSVSRRFITTYSLGGRGKSLSFSFIMISLLFQSTCVIQINFPTALLNDEDLEALQMVRIEVRSISVSHF